MATNHLSRAEEVDASYSDLKSTAKTAASNVSGDLKKSASEFGSAVKNLSTGALKDLEQRGRAAIDTVTGGAEEASKYLEGEIRKSPLMSLGIAFGLGMMMSSLLFRRS